jgi:hypothetical protein
MEWQYYGEADTSSLSVRPWYPSTVHLYKKLVDSDGNILTSTRITPEDALSTCEDLPALAANYLSVVRNHFDVQYDLIYTGRDEPHPSACAAFGNTLSACIRVYRTLLKNDTGEM